MSKLQVQKIYLLAQLEEFGLNPKDWDVEIKWPKRLVEFIHQKHDDFRFLGVLSKKEESLPKCHSLQLKATI